MLVLNAPARPRSLVATMIRWVSSLPVPASNLGVCGPVVILAASDETTSVIRAEYGRAAVAFCWARRNFAAATMFSALVIFCVDLTEPMRSLRALRLAILSFVYRRRPVSSQTNKSWTPACAGEQSELCKLLAECRQRGLERRG